MVSCPALPDSTTVILIDGLNVARSRDGRYTASSADLVGCADALEATGRRVFLVFDENDLGHQLDARCRERRPGVSIFFTAEADPVLLELASRCGYVDILSNDRFREYQSRYADVVLDQRRIVRFEAGESPGDGRLFFAALSPASVPQTYTELDVVTNFGAMIHLLLAIPDLVAARELCWDVRAALAQCPRDRELIEDAVDLALGLLDRAQPGTALHLCKRLVGPDVRQGALPGRMGLELMRRVPEWLAHFGQQAGFADPELYAQLSHAVAHDAGDR